MFCCDFMMLLYERRRFQTFKKSIKETEPIQV